MGVLFIGVLAVLWLCVVVAALRRRMFWHGVIALLSAGIVVFGGFAGNWYATGANPDVATSCCGLHYGYLIGMAVFVVVLAAVAIDMARRITRSSDPNGNGAVATG